MTLTENMNLEALTNREPQRCSVFKPIIFFTFFPEMHIIVDYMVCTK